MASSDSRWRLGDTKRDGLDAAYKALCEAARIVVRDDGGVVGQRALAYAECAEIVRKMRDGEKTA
jgi:hypothetical protein